MSRDEDALREKLDGWLDVLKAEVQGLTVNRHVFWEVQDMIRENQRLHLGSTFGRTSASTDSLAKANNTF